MSACTPLAPLRARLLAGCALAASIGSPVLGQSAFKATPDVVVGGIETSPGQVISGGLRDTVQVYTRQSVINWTPDDTATGGGAIAILPQGSELVFTANPADVGGAYTVLNRVIPNDPSRAIQFDGLVKSQFDSGYGATSGGNIWFYSPGGIIAGATSRFDVGSLVLSASDIDFAGGLFGTGTDAQTGAIRFRGASDSKSFVTVQPGAQLNASGNYLALVAPRITQGGALSVNGSAALIAAESADLTIPVSGGLFDIAVSVGSAVDAPGETTLTHSGTTAVTDPQATGAARRVYLMAVPKNDAVTMLVSGSLGYDAASQAQLANGAIVLTTGNSIANGDGVETFTPGQANVHVTGGDFNGDVSILGTSLALDTSTASLNATSISLLANGGGSIAITARRGRDINVANTLSASGIYLDASDLSDVSISADAGSMIHVGALDFQFSVIGREELCACDRATSATGVPISVAAAGGIITVDDNLQLISSGQGGEGHYGPAGQGTGGTIGVTASAGGRISVGRSLFLTANGRGGGSAFGGGVAAGDGIGGVATLLTTNGSIDAGGIFVTASGTGGSGGMIGGAGRGGTATVSVQDGSIAARDSSARIIATALGGEGATVSGAAQGGTAQLLLAGAATDADFQRLTILANATGGGTFGGATGGAASGGTALISAGAGTLTVAPNEGTAVRLESKAIGGFGNDRSGNATGGTVKTDLAGTAASLQSVGIDASARTTDAAALDTSFPPQAANGGNAVGGTAQLTFINAAVSIDRLSIELTGQGGNGFADSAGDGRGGAAQLTVSGGTLSLGAIDVDARGFGGGSHDFFGQVAQGGTGTGGSVSLDFSGVASELASLSLDASGEGGEGISAGDGAGGAIALTSRAGADLQLVEVFELLASGEGGSGFDSGGAATGGQIDLTSDGGSIAANFAYVDAGAFGGAAFGENTSALTAFGASALTASGFAGSAMGGTIDLLAKGGGSLAASGDYLANAEGGTGYSGTGAGQATGGTVTAIAAGGIFDFTAGTTEFAASGRAGASFGSSFAPTGRGGTVDVQIKAGAAGDPAGELLFATLLLTANGSIADLSDGGVAPGNAGTGVGGSAGLTMSAGRLDGSAIEVTADGYGGNGGQGSRAGGGHQGRAAFAMTGGTATLENDLRLYARAWGGAAPAEESGYGAAGIGGNAGIGANPFGSGAGAVATLGGDAQLVASSLELVADSMGGDGGDADGFTFEPGNGGAGGDAAGGIATFSSAGSSGVTLSTLSISAKGIGGDGGTVEYGYGSSLSGNASGGAGGRGTGGIATAELGGSAPLDVSLVQATANGDGGNGGFVAANDSFLRAGNGVGGAGGNGNGGTAMITVSASSAMTVFAEATGTGADGASGPLGGAGGAGRGGAASIEIAGGDHEFGSLSADARGYGGYGVSGDTGDGGRGGDATGGDARVLLTGLGDSSAFSLDVTAAAYGGRGGSGGFNTDADRPAANGGPGGTASGGNAALLISGGRFRVAGVESSASLSAAAFGGDGGSAGFGGADGSVAGIGGAGGTGDGGDVLASVSAGDVFLAISRLDASGTGGTSGGESGYGLVAGEVGAGRGGEITIAADDVADDGLALSVDLGQAELSADGYSGFGFGQELSGNILIRATTAGSATVLSFSALDAHARGTVLDLERGPGISTVAAGGPIAVSGFARYDALGAVAFAFDGGGGLRADGPVAISSFDTVSIRHGGAAGASIQGSTVTVHADRGVAGEAGSLLKAAGRIDVRSFGGAVDLAAADTAGDLTVGAAFGATIGSVTANNAIVFAGRADVEGGTHSGQDATITGKWQLTGNASVAASGDVIVAPAAQVVADRGVTFEAGDDIVIGSGALVRAANNAPPETGYGASDPLQQAAQLRLLAGGNYGEGSADGALGAILIDGTLEAPDRTIFMSAGAVSAGPATQLTAGNLYVRLFNIPVGDQLPSDDGGQLIGACMEGSVCLGTTNVSGVVRIGESGFEPINLRLGGGIDGTDVLLRARSVELGQAGVANAIAASDRLTIESTGENLILDGPLAITGGSNLARIASARSIAGAEATLAAPGTLDLFAAKDITLAGIEAATIRTVDFDGTVLNAGGITLPGTASIGRFATTGALLVDAAGGIAIDTLATNGAATLAAASGSVIVSKDARTAGLTAAGRLVNLTGAEGLGVSSATATEGDVVLATLAGDLSASNVTASGAIRFDAAGAIHFNRVNAGGALTMTAGGDVTSFLGGGGASVDITTPGKVDVTFGLAASSGAMSVDAANGIHAMALLSAGDLTLMASNGAIQTDVGTTGTNIVAIGKSVGLINGDGLTVRKAVATGGNVSLAARQGALDVDTITATGGVSLAGPAGLSFGSIDAGGRLLIEPMASIDGGTASASHIFANSTGTFSAGRLVASSGVIRIAADGGIALDSVSGAGDIDLKAADGALTIASDIVAGGSLQASGRSLNLHSLGDLTLDQGTTSDGDMRLASAGGNVTLGQVSASKALNVTAPGTIAVSGAVSGATIGFTSSDLAIGAEGQVGSKSATSALTLTSTAERLLLGDASGDGYRIDNDEFARIASGGDVSIVSAPASFQAEAFELLDPTATNVVVGSMSFDGAQLGSTGTFKLVTPRSIGIVGNAQYKNFGNSQTVTYTALNDISLAAETGLVTVRDNAGALAGTLRLEAQQVHALSTKARSEIAGLQLNEVRQRLGTNDQVENDGGYFQAGAIVVRIGRLAFIQNSGANGDDPIARRGFTANSLKIETASSAPAQLVVNGRVGTATGADVIASTNLSGSFDPQSAFNGCLAGASCGVAPPPPPPPPMPELTPVLTASRDQVRSDEDKDETEESLDAAQTRPDPVIQFVAAPASRFDPLIDEPVTGAGNEDLWLTPRP